VVYDAHMTRRSLRHPIALLPAGERFRSGVLISALAHVGVLAIALAAGARLTREYYRPIGQVGMGTGGGGGGGGGTVDHYIELPPALAAPSAPRQTAPPAEPVELALPRPELEPVSAPRAVMSGSVDPPPVVVVGQGPGMGGGVGAGTGTGGGIGSGRGTGIGAGVGPGTGTGEGGSVIPPEPKFTIVPAADRPESVRGREFRVHFWVDATGKVTRVEIEPQIPDADYRRRFMEQMRQYQFAPARSLDGRPVAGRVTIAFSL
jgi:protein TonB